jgi:hypothetical protein
MASSGIKQPIEGTHPPKRDVPQPLATSATAGEDKIELEERGRHFTGEASLTPEIVDRTSAESADWEPPVLAPDRLSSP